MSEALTEHQFTVRLCAVHTSGVSCCFHRLLLGVDLVRFHHLFSLLQFAVNFLVKIYHNLRIVALFYASVCDFEFYYGVQMSDRDEFHETPRHSSQSSSSPPSSRKRPSGDRDTLVGHSKKDRQDYGVQQVVACASPPSHAGTSQIPDVNTATAGPSPVDDGECWGQVDRCPALLYQRPAC